MGSVRRSGHREGAPGGSAIFLLSSPKHSNNLILRGKETDRDPRPGLRRAPAELLFVIPGASIS